MKTENRSEKAKEINAMGSSVVNSYLGYYPSKTITCRTFDGKLTLGSLPSRTLEGKPSLSDSSSLSRGGAA